MVGRVTDENVFQLRLNELFSGSDRRLTNVAVAHGLLARGCRISTAYLSQLRHGARSSPSDEVVSALADYFDVPPGYFFTIPWSGDRARARRGRGDSRSSHRPGTKTVAPGREWTLGDLTGTVVESGCRTMHLRKPQEDAHTDSTSYT